jgi:hypothetical protein
MNVKGKYLKDEEEQIFSPIVNSKSVFDNNGNLLSDVKISKPEVSENEVLDENSDVEDNNNLVDNSEDD